MAGQRRAPAIGDGESLGTRTVEHTVTVESARGTDYGLDTSGFTLLAHETAVDLRDEAPVHERYFAEVTPLVREQTGADHVFVTHHLVRWGNPEDFEDGYAAFLHGDRGLDDSIGYTAARMEELGIELPTGQDYDFARYSTWQPVEREVRQHPLALVDARSVVPEDVHDYFRTGVGDPHPESSPVYAPGHVFRYLPRIHPGELLMFRQLDTRPHRAPTCLHSTVTDPTAPADAPLRRGVEVRWMCASGREPLNPCPRHVDGKGAHHGRTDAARRAAGLAAAVGVRHRRAGGRTRPRP